VLHGKEISFNNLLDISTAIKMMSDFEPPTTILFKHTNPCGVGTGDGLVSAFQKAFATDTQSPFGGIFAFNRSVDMALVNEINRIFCDVIIAPDFDKEALAKLKKKKNRRLIRMKSEIKENYEFDIKRVIGGIEIQQFDEEFESVEHWKVVTEREPTDDEMSAMKFAWKVVKWTKSNAIVLAKADRTIGIGPGQTDRVGALEVAISKAQKYEHDFDDAVLASDAFFPFADSVQLAAAKGIRAVIQPGGSIRDQEVIDAADELGIAMVFTGRRHFRH
jgi:phosphoribosylaminoimidazolecarboxamide formyltransferase/IMP cyclohydrolase